MGGKTDADPFAVRTMTSCGEEIAFSDPYVSDEQRAAAGRETVAARMRALLPENRRRAAAAYAAGGLPDGQEVLRVWCPRDAAGLRERLGDSRYAAWAEDDILHVLWRGTAEQVMLSGGVQVPLWPVEGTVSAETGEGLWEASLRVRRLDEAVITVLVIGLGAADLPFGRPVTDTMTWRGPRAPAEPADGDGPIELAGEVREHTIESAPLRGPREVTVYVPPGAAGAPGPLPGCVLADGQSVAGFARVLEPAIASGAAPPVVLVGVHNAGGHADRSDLRAQEYLPRHRPRRFAAHLSFVTDEVIPWAAASLPVDPSGRPLAGGRVLQRGGVGDRGRAAAAGGVRRGGGAQRGDRAAAGRGGVPRRAALPRGGDPGRGVPAIDAGVGDAAAAGRGAVQPSRVAWRPRPVLVATDAARRAGVAARVSAIAFAA